MISFAYSLGAQLAWAAHVQQQAASAYQQQVAWQYEAALSAFSPPVAVVSDEGRAVYLHMTAHGFLAPFVARPEFLRPQVPVFKFPFANLFYPHAIDVDGGSEESELLQAMRDLGSMGKYVCFVDPNTAVYVLRVFKEGDPHHSQMPEGCYVVGAGQFLLHEPSKEVLLYGTSGGFPTGMDDAKIVADMVNRKQYLLASPRGLRVIVQVVHERLPQEMRVTPEE